jgi:hypothetical protein
MGVRIPRRLHRRLRIVCVEANRSVQRFVTEMPPPDDVQWISDLDDEIEVLYYAAMPRHMQVRRRHPRSGRAM